MSDLDKLKEMVNSYPTIVQNLDTQIATLDPLINDLSEQKSAIENEVLAPLLADSNNYIQQKAIELTGIACILESCTACTSGGYGISNLTDWAIVSGGCVLVPPATSFVIVWGPNDCDPLGPIEDADQYQRQMYFAEAYGHIHDPVDINGTYGIEANMTNLNTGKTILQNNKAKYETVRSIYEQYTS
jgi:hypothetical protein